MLKAGVLHHVEEEEDEVFPKMVESATEEQLVELARQCEEMIVAAGEQPPLDPDAATRDELYKRPSARASRAAARCRRTSWRAALEGS